MSTADDHRGKDGKEFWIGYSLFLAKEHKHVEIRVVGEIDALRARDMTGYAQEVGRRLEIARYLVDVTACRNVDPNGTYDLAGADTPNRLPLDVLVAILVDPDDHTHDIIEARAEAAGYHRAKIFRDREAAVRYLRQSDAD